MTKAVNLVLIILVLGFICASSVAAQTTEITYQGSLQESGLPANANYDIEFRLFSAATGGSLIVSPISLSNVAVTNGVFSVKLDFGLNGFTGQDRHLEIAVRRTGVGSHVTLGPRQKINSAPYAIQSLRAASATMATSASNALALNGISAAQYVVTGDPRLSDARNPLPGSSNYIQNTNSVQASSKFNISGNGSAATFNATSRYNFNGTHLISAAGLDNIFAGAGAGLLTTGNNNSFFGSMAGQENKAGNFNAFFGAYAGQNNVTGSSNSFFGFFAGNSTTTGNENSFFGNRAGQVNTSGANNSFFGTFSGFFNDIGSDNSFIGNAAGYSNKSGNRNSFVGSQAGRANETGSDNAFIGSFAGHSNDTGSFNSFVGSSAGRSNIAGNNNSFFGTNAGFSNIASQNSFFGTDAGKFNSSGANNTFLGRAAGLNNTVGELNVFIGLNAGQANLLGRNNTIIGAEANVNGNNLSYATAIGAEAVVSSSNTVVLGRPADQVRIPGSLTVTGMLNATGISINANNLIGVVGTANGGTGLTSAGMAGRFLRSDGTNWVSETFKVTDILPGSTHYVHNSTTQQGSTNFNISGNGTAGGTLWGNAINSTTQYNIGGSRVLSAPGGTNLFAGLNAGNSNTTGGSNAFFGNAAGTLNTSGSSNSFFGAGAGQNSATGGGNTFSGSSAGAGNTSGANNAFFGANAGQTNTIGSSNTVIGANANVGGNNLTYATAIGSDAVVSTNNTVVLGRTADVVRVPGNLEVSGTLSAITFSVPASNLTGTVPVIRGGTGLAASGASGNFLRSNGSIWESSAIAASDIPSGSANYIQNSVGVQASSNFNISGTGTVGGAFSAQSVNSSTQFNVGGNRVLSAQGTANIFAGIGTGTSGNDNSFFGFGAGSANTTGFSNTVVGSGANVGAGNLSFATALGAGATVSNSNSVVLGRAADTVRIPGSLNVSGSINGTFTVPATNISGTIPTGSGGTGLANSGASGNFLRSNGTAWTSSALSASDIPSGSANYIQNGASQQAGNFNIAGSGTIGTNLTVSGNLTVNGNLAGTFTVPAANIIGTIPAAAGGTGLTSATGTNFLRGNGSGGWVSGTLQAGDIPSLGGTYIQNTTTQQAVSNFNISGDGTAGGSLNANVVNSATEYRISGARVFATNATSSIFAGAGAGNTGSGNAFFGSGAGATNSVGSSNTLVGASADVGSGNLTNATAIGANAQVTQSNSLILGGISGVNGGSSVNVGIGTPAPKAKLDVTGGNILVAGPGQGIILKSPDGNTCKLLSIDNAGAMVLANATCP